VGASERRSLVGGAGVRTPAASWPLLAKGFRPFFALAALHAIVVVPLWLAILQGKVLPGSCLDPAVWHAHEMLGGFVTAVVAGFLLTAVGNWTQRETAVGGWLAALVVLWLAGRAAMLLASALPRGVAALVDLAFLPALGFGLARPLLVTHNRRNYVVLGVLAALFAAGVTVHLDALGLVPLGSARRANLASVDLIVLLISLIAGRTFPMFTRNATGAQEIRSIPWLDRACVGTMALLVVADAALPDYPRFGAILAATAALLAACRAVHWGARHSFREPLLWILHVGYGWLVLGLLLRGVAGIFGATIGSAATHALTLGAIGSLTLGMMARVALGHTGRLLVAPAPMTPAFVAITLAALARVLVPLLAPSWYHASLFAAGLFWTLAFARYLASYTPMLLRARVDGKPG
jgi:uncharacterized protein involved in response to NO